MTQRRWIEATAAALLALSALVGASALPAAAGETACGAGLGTPGNPAFAAPPVPCAAKPATVPRPAGKNVEVRKTPEGATTWRSGDTTYTVSGYTSFEVTGHSR